MSQKSPSNPQEPTSEKPRYLGSLLWIDQLVAALENIAKAAEDEKVDREALTLLAKTCYDDLHEGPIDPKKYESG